jgi:hypothetical protein
VVVVRHGSDQLEHAAVVHPGTLESRAVGGDDVRVIRCVSCSRGGREQLKATQGVCNHLSIDYEYLFLLFICRRAKGPSKGRADVEVSMEDEEHVALERKGRRKGWIPSSSFFE